MKQPISIDNSPAQNKIINATGNQIIVTLPSAKYLDRNKEYEVGLINASIVYCNPNCINRYVRFTYMKNNYDIPIPNGLYSLNVINLQFTILTSFLYDNGLFYVEGIEATSQCILYCNDYTNTTVSFQSNNDNIFDLLGFVNTDTKFIPQSAVSYLLSPNKVQLNNISNFYISLDNTNSYIINGQRSNIIHFEPITASPFSTQVIKPFEPTFTKINKSILIDSFTITLTGDNNTTIDMTGGTGLSGKFVLAHLELELYISA